MWLGEKKTKKNIPTSTGCEQGILLCVGEAGSVAMAHEYVEFVTSDSGRVSPDSCDLLPQQAQVTDVKGV